MGTGCSDSSQCHTHYVSKWTWTCCDLKRSFCLPSKPVMTSGKRMSRSEVKCTQQLLVGLSLLFVVRPYTLIEKNTNSCAPGLLYRCLAKYNSIPRIFRTHRKVLAWQQNHFNFLKCLLRCDEARHKMKVIYFQYVYCQIDSIFAMCNDSTTPVQYIRFISHGYHYTGNQSAQVHLCIINHLTRRHVRIKKAKQQAHSNISRFNKHTHTIPF